MKNIEDIREQVESRLVARRAEFEVARTRERRIVAIALAAFAIAAAATLLSLDGLLGLHWSWTPLAALILMIFMVVWREGATQRARRLQFAVDWLERWCDRLDDRWEFSRDPGSEYDDASHPYVSDLDVFGEGSVFERLNATYTVLGRDDLAGLLTDQAPAGTAEERQVAVRELRDAWNERELFEVELRSLGERTDEGSEASTRLDRDTRALLDWGASETAPPEPAAIAWLHFLLGVSATFTIVAHFALGWSWGPFIAHYLLNLVVLGRAKDIDGLLEKFEKVRETLDAWSRCLVHMERYEPEAALLKKVREPLLSGSLTASLAIKKLKSLADRLSWKRNKFWAATFDVLWLWDLHARRSLLLWNPTLTAALEADPRHGASGLAEVRRQDGGHAQPGRIRRGGSRFLLPGNRP